MISMCYASGNLVCPGTATEARLDGSEESTTRALIVNCDDSVYNVDVDVDGWMDGWRERGREGGRQTDRQAARQTQRERQTDRQMDRRMR